MAKVNIKIEGVPYQVESGMTILEAARLADTRFLRFARSTTESVPKARAEYAS